MTPQNNSHFHCEAVQEYLPFYAAGQMTMPERAMIQRHLATCAACREQLATWQIVAGVVRAEAEVRVGDGVLPPLEIGIEPQSHKAHKGKNEMILVKPMRNAQSLRRMPTQRSFITALVALFAAFLLIGIQIVARISPAGQYAATPQGQGVPTNPPVITAENASKLQPVTQFGRGAVYEVAWRNEGMLAIASESGLYYYDIGRADTSADGYKSIRLGMIDEPISDIAFAPAGRYFASITHHLLTLRDVETGKVIRTYDSVKYAVDVQYSPDSSYLLVTACQEEVSTSTGLCDNQWMLVAINVETGEVLKSWNGLEENPTAAISFDGQYIAYSSWDNDRKVSLVNVTGVDTHPTMNFNMSGRFVQEMQFGPDHTQLAILNVARGINNYQDNRVYVNVYDVSQAPQTEIDEMLIEREARALSFTADGAQIGYLVSGGISNSVYIHRQIGSEERILATFPMNIGDYNNVVISPDQKSMVIQDMDSSLTLWKFDKQTMSLVDTVQDFTSSTHELVIAPHSANRSWLAFNNLGRIEVWDYLTGTRIDHNRLTSELTGGETLTFNASGQLAYPKRDNTLTVGLWNAENSFTQEQIDNLRGFVLATAFDPEARLTAIALSPVSANSSLVVLRQLEDGSFERVELQNVKAPYYQAYPVFSSGVEYVIIRNCFSEQGSSECYGGAGLSLFDTRTGELLGDIQAGYSLLFSLQVTQQSSDERELIALSGCAAAESRTMDSFYFYDCTHYKLSLWDVKTLVNGDSDEAEPLFEIETSTYAQMAISPDGQLLVSKENGDSLVMRAIDSDEEIAHLPVANVIDSIAFNDTGTLLAVGGSGIVTLWAVVE